jgi:hypothetical protein
VRRDTNELHERMDAVIRLAKAIKRTTAEPQRVAEEDYDALHQTTIAAHDRMVAAWKAWAQTLPRGEARPAEPPPTEEALQASRKAAVRMDESGKRVVAGLHGVAAGLREGSVGPLAEEQPDARAELCPDCGIPRVWCKRVSSDPAHCWRWDYERFDDMASECVRLREQLDAARQALEQIADFDGAGRRDYNVVGELRQIACAVLGVVGPPTEQTTDVVSAPSNSEGRAGGSDA